MDFAYRDNGNLLSGRSNKYQYCIIAIFFDDMSAAMTSPALNFPTVRLTTDPMPARDRMAITQEVFGRQILNLELEQNPDAPLRVDFTMRALPGLKIVTGFASGVISRRTRKLLADSNDDLFLSVNETNLFFASQRGQETTMRPGDAVFMSCAEPAAFRRSDGYATGLRVPRTFFAHIKPVIEDAAGLYIPAQNEALRLIRGYIGAFDKQQPWQLAELGHVVSDHIRDLLTLAIESAGDAAAVAAGRGLKAARLREIKSHVARNLCKASMSIGTVAAAHGLSDRYVQRLFEAEGTTFTTFIVHQRLARAYRLLRNPLHTDRRISAIAEACGFVDVSHFNRIFRRLYGLSPSEVRDEGRRPR
jgi:AraC-like DNA-binding protein